MERRQRTMRLRDVPVVARRHISTYLEAKEPPTPTAEHFGSLYHSHDRVKEIETNMARPSYERRGEYKYKTEEELKTEHGKRKTIKKASQDRYIVAHKEYYKWLWDTGDIPNDIYWSTISNRDLSSAWIPMSRTTIEALQEAHSRM